MLKATYLTDQNVDNFINWLQQRISGTQPINFMKARTGVTFRYLSDALRGYAWPDRATTINYPTGGFTLPAISNMAANTRQLNIMSAALIHELSAAGTHRGFSDWAKCVMEWGGVIHGNISWITSNTTGIRSVVSSVISIINTNDDDIRRFPATLRFNSGMTKLYSLLVNNFIIYDSRVAAAITWLVHEWNCHRVSTSPLLAFRCMPARPTIMPKIRNPNPKTIANPNGFPWMNSNHRNHLHWNMRANWILEEAFNQAMKNHPHISFGNLREIEAALFMIGEDLP